MAPLRIASSLSLTSNTVLSKSGASQDDRSNRAATRLGLAGLLVTAALIGQGCQTAPQQPATNKPSENGQLATRGGQAGGLNDSGSPFPLTAPGSTMLEPPKLDPADLLLERMKNYATRLDPAVEQHMGSGATITPAAPKSSVVWTSPGPPTQPVKPVVPVVVPLVRPIVDSSPSNSNQMAAIPGTGTSNPTGVSIQVTPQDLNHSPSAVTTTVVASDPIERGLIKHLQEYPRDIWAHLDYELLQFVHDRRDPLMSSSSSLPAEDRELIRAIVDAVNNFRELVRSEPNLLLSRKVRPLLDLGDRLRAMADLSIPTLALCTKVDGFGVYEPIDPARFTAGKEHMAIVYCEVENFSSALNDRKQWETKLTQETVLYREDGLAVWQDKTKSIVDLSRNRRHDFFIVKMVKLPSTLTIGRYMMKVSIQDMQASRFAETTVPVEIVAQ